MKFLILVLTFSTSLAFAVPKAAKIQKKPIYDISTVITLDGVKRTPRFRLLNGLTAQITEIKQGSDNLFTEVTINKHTLEGKPAVQMEFVIGKVDALGNKTIIATPKILANLGEKASVMIGDKKLIISATATKATR